LADKRIYNITEFGAKVNDKLQTPAIQTAIDLAFVNGGGKVVIPKGIFRTGGLRLRSCVELHLDSGAILKGSSNPEDYFGYLDDPVEPIKLPPDEEADKISRSVYPYSRWNNSLIRVIDAYNVAITGDAGSYIDGVNTYDPLGEENYRGPHGINIQNCNGVYLDGYTITDCGNWAHAIFNSQNIICRNVAVFGGHDGFDVRTCDNVLVEDCEFRTGDDCIAGFDNNDVIVRRCILDSSCSAFRFGGNHVLIEDCTALAPGSFAHRGTLPMEKRVLSAPTGPDERHNMLTFFLYYCDFRAVIRRTPGDIVIRNCKAVNCDSLFALQYDGKHKWCCNRSLSSIRFENCDISGVCKPIIIYGDAEEPLTFELCDSSLSARDGYSEVPAVDARNYSAIVFDNVQLSGYTEPSINVHTNGKVVCGKDVSVQFIDDGNTGKFFVE